MLWGVHNELWWPECFSAQVSVILYSLDLVKLMKCIVNVYLGVVGLEFIDPCSLVMADYCRQTVSRSMDLVLAVLPKFCNRYNEYQQATVWWYDAIYRIFRQGSKM